jgi:hypothetical protein
VRRREIGVKVARKLKLEVDFDLNLPWGRRNYPREDDKIYSRDKKKERVASVIGVGSS